MRAKAAVVRGGPWLGAVTRQLAELDVDTLAVNELSPPQRVLFTLIAIDRLSSNELAGLVRSTQAGEWAAPCLLGLVQRSNPGLPDCLRVGLCHHVALTANGPLVPSGFAQTVRRFQGQRRMTLPAHLGERAAAQSFRIVQSSDKDGVIRAVGNLAARHGVADRLVDRVRTAMDELITNALYNAPVEKDGQRRNAALSRSIAVKLKPGEVIEASVAVGTRHLALRVTDPFGSLEHDRLRSVLARTTTVSDVESKPGGAGLGLGWLLSTATQLIITITQNRSTEVVALFDRTTSNRVLADLPHSLDVFSEEAPTEHDLSHRFAESVT